MRRVSSPPSVSAGRWYSPAVADALLRRLIFSKMNRAAMPAVNEMRARLGLGTLAGITDLLRRPPLVFYFTTREFEYPRPHWPENFRMVGPARWVPPAVPPEWLAAIERPIALVTCSTERQSDRGIVEAAIQGLPQSGFYVVATSAAYEPREFQSDGIPNCRVERYLSHGPIVERARIVVCHGGMGITQRALAQGVPLVVVPFGRDQLEVARRVEHAGAGVRLVPSRLNADSLAAAAKEALSMSHGVKRIADAFAAADADNAVADGLEELLQGQRPAGTVNAQKAKASPTPRSHSIEGEVSQKCSADRGSQADDGPVDVHLRDTGANRTNPGGVRLGYGENAHTYLREHAREND